MSKRLDLLPFLVEMGLMETRRPDAVGVSQ